MSHLDKDQADSMPQTPGDPDGSGLAGSNVLSRF